MKKIATFVIFVLLLFTVTFTASATAIHIIAAPKVPWSEIWKYLAIGIPALYDFLVRIIPTVKDYTVVGKLLKILKWVSDLLNLRSTSMGLSTFINKK